jgi:hypothetical protein
MRKAVIAGSALFCLLLLLWIVGGVLVWSRNSYAAPSFSPRRSLPANNAYTVYTDAVRSVRSPKEILKLFGDSSPPAEARARVLRENAAVLKSLKAAASQPSVVTELEPKQGFVAAIDFPNVSRLLALEGRARASGAPKTALEPMIDGLRFSEGVMRGGAMLHLLTAYMAYAPLFQAFPDMVRAAPADACRSAADEIKSVIKEQASLDEIVANEHAVRYRQLVSTFPKPSRVFSLDIPWSGYERDFTLKPKAPAVEGLNRYFEAWKVQAKQPITRLTPPPAPTGLQGILNDDGMGPEEMTKRVLQFYWRDARLRMVYTALRLEQQRRQKGRYPSSLGGLGADPLFTDPFSGQPLVYNSAGTSYSLYSVGPNGKDDGGAPLNEARLNPKADGDLPLNPTFGRRLEGR